MVRRLGRACAAAGTHHIHSGELLGEVFDGDMREAIGLQQMSRRHKCRRQTQTAELLREVCVVVVVPRGRRDRNSGPGQPLETVQRLVVHFGAGQALRRERDDLLQIGNSPVLRVPVEPHMQRGHQALLVLLGERLGDHLLAVQALVALQQQVNDLLRVRERAVRGEEHVHEGALQLAVVGGQRLDEARQRRRLHEAHTHRFPFQV